MTGIGLFLKGRRNIPGGKRRGYNTENRKLRNKTLSKIFFNKDERKKDTDAKVQRD